MLVELLDHMLLGFNLIFTLPAAIFLLLLLIAVDS
jgi:hypothetical protein